MFTNVSRQPSSRNWKKASGHGSSHGAATTQPEGSRGPLRANSIPYRGVNVLMLWASAMEQGFGAPSWLTYKQARNSAGRSAKGQKGSLVVYADTISRTETDADTGEAHERDIPFLKGYTVFNAEQVDGLPERFTALAAPALDPPARIERVERFFTATGATIRHGGNRAFYSPAEDRVQMPPFEAFRDAESYYAVLAHELTHWTKHGKRLDRDFGRKRFDDEGYAMEELVAELGSAFLSADLDLTPEPRPEHAAYIASWLKLWAAGHNSSNQQRLVMRRITPEAHVTNPRLARPFTLF